jgi:hypothetical protein
MARKPGVIARSLFDWNADTAQHAQQWFSLSSLNYWGFTLFNNAADGKSLYVYDAQATSGPNFGAGTGNPSGNPNAVAGGQGGTGQIQSIALISNTRNAAFASTQITVTNPGSLVAGNFFLLTLFASGPNTAAQLTVEDAGYVRLGGVDGNATTPAIACFGKILTASEPATFKVDCVNNGNFGYHQMQFSNLEAPAQPDASLGQFSTVATNTPISPAVVTNGQNDLIYCVFCTNNGVLWTNGYDARFTGFSVFSSSNLQWEDGFIPGVKAGVNGPYLAPNPVSNSWAALTVAIRGSVLANAPNQYLAQPIKTVTPLSPGLLSMQFGSTPIALPGNTFWLPPAADFKWDREAPIAIVRPSASFNLAGITPEQAAWASMSWYAAK